MSSDKPNDTPSSTKGFGTDVLIVDTAPGELVGGARSEPEEHQIDVRTPMVLQSGSGLNIKGQIVVQTTVEEMARKTKYACRGCAHWNNAFWIEYLALAKQKVENIPALNKLRNQCLSSTDAEFIRKHENATGEFDPEHALNAFGMCQKITDMKRDMGRVFDAALTLTLPDEASCANDPAFQNAFGEPTLFSPRTKESFKDRQNYADNLKRAASTKPR